MGLRLIVSLLYVLQTLLEYYGNTKELFLNNRSSRQLWS